MQTFAGIANRQGPGYSAVMVGVHACAQMAASATLAALFRKQSGGNGAKVSVSLERALLAYDMVQLIGNQLRARGIELPAPIDPATIMPTINYHPVQCADGRWLQLGNLLPHLLQAFLDEAGLERDENEDEESFRARLLTHMQTRTSDEWMQRFLANGSIVAHRYQSTREALDDADITANGHVVTRGPVSQLGVVARLSATPGRVSFTVPEPGEFALPQSPSADVLAGKSVVTTKSAAKDRGALLEGVTVVEFATIIAAPLGCSVLADLGARVIKVETPGGDPFRGMLDGLGAARVNTGKESIILDLKTDAGRDAARRLIRSADVLVHNFRQGVPEKLGIDYAAARLQRPDIIHVAVSGYGPDGPGARRPSTHPIPGAAMGGVFYQLGGEPPTEQLQGDELRDWARKLFRANEVNPDPNTSMVTATAVLLALMARKRHGVGQAVSVDMFCANAYANFDDFLSYPGKPDRPCPRRDQTGFDGYELRQTGDGWVFQLGAQQVSAQRTIAEFLTSPEAREAGLVTEAAHAEWGRYQRHGPLIVAPDQTLRGACSAGEHTAAILQELGYSAAEVESFMTAT
jgi:crotonobetainyl-CoA:carnitine CoA-transferase CaiB-like acyl-CoA transferase